MDRAALDFRSEGHILYYWLQYVKEQETAVSAVRKGSRRARYMREQVSPIKHSNL